METLREAYQMARSNNRAPGLDGVTFQAIEEGGSEVFLGQIRTALVNNTYRPMPARKKEIPKLSIGPRSRSVSPNTDHDAATCNERIARMGDLLQNCLAKVFRQSRRISTVCRFQGKSLFDIAADATRLGRKTGDNPTFRELSRRGEFGIS
jgi:hypothetical protein